MTDTLRLVDRLRGNYILPVNDGAGPLDGKMTFERQYKMDYVQIVASEFIKQLEEGKPYTQFAVQFMIDQLLEKKDWAGLGLDPYVAPINYEAVEELKKYLD
jgi:hypothetical protein